MASPRKNEADSRIPSISEDQSSRSNRSRDPGIIYRMKQNPECALPFIYAGNLSNERSSNQFWGQKGAKAAVLAREVPFEEMKIMAPQLNIPVEVLVYGATCIHQSKRPLLQNYYNYTQQSEEKNLTVGCFI